MIIYIMKRIQKNNYLRYKEIYLSIKNCAKKHVQYNNYVTFHYNQFTSHNR